MSTQVHLLLNAINLGHSQHESFYLYTHNAYVSFNVYLMLNLSHGSIVGLKIEK